MRPSVTNKPFGPVDGSFESDPTVYLSKLFVYFLQNLFRDFPEGSGMKWHENEETTEIYISREKPRPATLEKVPSITVIIGNGRMNGLGFDQMQATNMNQGSRTHTDLMAMTAAYHCQAKDGVVARRIAWNAGFYTNVLRRIIMRVGGLHHVSPSWEWGAEGPATALTGATSDSEVVSCVDTIPFYWQPQWHITEPSHLWRRLRVQLKVRKDGFIYRASKENALRPPRVMGRPVNTRPITEPEVVLTQVVLETSLTEE